MSKKLTNEEIDRRLAGRNIKRLEDYPGSNIIPTLFQCLLSTCCYEWRIPTANVLGGNGCPKCGGTTKLTNENIDQRLYGRNIQRLDDRTNLVKDDISWWKCLVCDYEWRTSLGGLLNKRSGCPKCEGLAPLTNEDVDQRLTGRKIIRLEDYIDSNTPIKWQCSECAYIWKVAPDPVLNKKKTGCPRCNDHIPFTNEMVDQKLIGRSIKRISKCETSHVKMTWQCLICEHEWQATRDHVLNKWRGCPKCPTGKNEKLIGEILTQNQIKYVSQKQLKDIIFVDTPYIIDYYLPDQNVIIEYNGRQHYEPVCFGGITIKRAQHNFENQKIRDARVQQLCLDHNIQLVWIDGRKYEMAKLKKYIEGEIVLMLMVLPLTY